MKKFIYQLLVFSLPILVISFPLDFVISHFLSKSRQVEYEVMNDIYTGTAKCDIAIYGSSRAMVHINPSILENSLGKSSYNFGINGHNFWLQYLRHLELLKHNGNPKTIIVSVDIFTLQKRADLYHLNQFLPYMLWNRNIFKYVSSSTGYNKYDYFIPLIRYIGKKGAVKASFKNFLKFQASISKSSNKGFVGMEREWDPDPVKVNAQIEKFNNKPDKLTICLFERFLQECKQSHIDVILVYTPEYIQGQRAMSNRSEAVNIFKQLSAKYDLLYLDYSNDELSFNKDLFYDISHLNKKGADLFTTKLATHLKSADIKHKVVAMEAEE